MSQVVAKLESETHVVFILYAAFQPNVVAKSLNVRLVKTFVIQGTFEVECLA